MPLKMTARQAANGMTHTFTILGAPRTKKNHGRVVQRGRRKFHIQSEAHETWHTEAMWRLAEIRIANQAFPLSVPVDVKAIFYRDRATGDFTGYAQALGDLLQDARIIENDRLIRSWDGSYLSRDPENPRIEITITEASRK